MTRPDSYATPAAFWTAVRAAVRNDAGKSGVPARDLVQLQLFDRFLSRVNADPETTPFRLKGGTRMLAFIPQARATVDIDLEVAQYGVDAAVDALAELVRVDNGDRLQFILTKRRQSHSSDDQPGITMVALTFTAAGINQQVKIDLAVHDRADGPVVRAAPKFRLPLGRDVPTTDYVMITLEQQIADKVAAMMERRHGAGNGDGRSSRAKDLVDLAIIAQHLTVEAAPLLAALLQQIRDRELAAFTEVDASSAIRIGYTTAARKARGLTLTWQESEALTNKLINPVLTGRVTVGSWNPSTATWISGAEGSHRICSASVGSMEDILNYFAGREGYDEPAQITIYDVWIKSQQVRLELTDRGATQGAQRYAVTAYSVDVPATDRVINSHGLSIGNPDETIEGALSNVHWNVFEHAA